MSSSKKVVLVLRPSTKVRILHSMHESMSSGTSYWNRFAKNKAVFIHFTKLYCSKCFEEIKEGDTYTRTYSRFFSRYYHESCAIRMQMIFPNK